MSAAFTDDNLSEEHLEELLGRDGQRLSAAERRSAAIVGVAFVLGAALLALLAPPPAPADWPTALVALLAVAVAMNVRFDIGAGYTVATQPAFVALLFAFPPALLAPAMVVALIVGRAPEIVAGTLKPSRLPLAIPNAWFVLGPAAILAVAEPGGGTRATIGLVVLALVAQIVVDFVASCVREALVTGASVREQLAEAVWVYAVDAALTPVGFLAARSLPEGPVAILCLLPLLALLGVFSRERRARMESLVELNSAYRGTALVLGDVIEADDGYTGEHSQGVVSLAMKVGGQLQLSPASARNLEFAALLHDVGKVAIPKEIINKPGALDPDEWRIIKTHTVEGQKLLDKIGGFMGEVGLIVRAHHERWDGGGYPDGTVGEAIPMEARIVCCCDAYNAMTTTRSYRRAMSVADATAELLRHAGTQFDPRVVAALLAVVGVSGAEPEDGAGDGGLRLAA